MVTCYGRIMEAWTITLLALYTLLFTFPLYLFMCADSSDSGINGIISRFFIVLIPGAISQALRFCLGELCFGYIERCYDYVANQRNPIMQVLYVALINGAFIAWVVTGMAKLPTFLVHKVHAYISVIFILIAQYTYYLACTKSPGDLTVDNVSCFNHQPYDGLMYLPGAYCTSCNIPKVLTSYFLLLIVNAFVINSIHNCFLSLLDLSTVRCARSAFPCSTTTAFGMCTTLFSASSSPMPQINNYKVTHILVTISV